MPREVKDIRDFSAGIVSLPDKKDIPENAASWSENIDPVTVPGRLIARYADGYENSIVKGTYFSSIVRETGEYDLIYYRDDTGKLRSYTDFYGTPADTELDDLGTGKMVAMQVHNREVHIGYGLSGGEKSKWVGYISHDQFGVAPSDGIYVLDAELEPALKFPSFHKVVSDGTNAYGIEWMGKRIYKINVETGALTYSKSLFSALTAITMYSSGVLVVADRRGDLISDIYLSKINTNDLSLGDVCTLASGPTPLSFDSDITAWRLTDLAITSTYMWFSFYAYASANGQGYVRALASTDGTGFLFKTLKTNLFSGTSAVALTDVTWRMDAHASDSGSYLGMFNTVGGYLIQVKTPLIVKSVTGTEIAYLMYSGALNYKDASAAYTFSTPEWGLTWLEETTVRNTRLSGVIDDEAANANSPVFQVVLPSAESDPSNGHHSLYCGFFCSSGLILLGDTTSPSTGTQSMMFYIDQSDFPFSKAGAAWKTIGTTPHGHVWVYASHTTTEAFPDSDLSAATGVYISTVGSYDTFVYLSCKVNEAGRIIRKRISLSMQSMESAEIFVGYGGVSLVTSAGEDTSSSIFSTKRYHYKVALRYDSYQDSPLTIESIPVYFEPGDLSKKISILIRLYDIGNTLSRRVTSIMLYRAESSVSVEMPNTFFRLVGEFDIREKWNSRTDANWGVFYEYQFQDDGKYGPSYESVTGISEVLENNTMDYELSTQLLGYHFVSRCYNEELDEGSHLLVRSKQGAFDQFDWTTDILYLPKLPVALSAFNGYVFAFTESEIYRINPQGMYIEEILHGYGALNPRSVVVTPAGMFIADRNNIYLHDGTSLIPIGDKIKYITNIYGKSWDSIVTKVDNPSVCVVSYPKYGAVIVFICVEEEYEPPNPKTYSIVSYILTLNQKRWDYWIHNQGLTSSVMGAFMGKEGEVYVSYSEGLWEICGSTMRNTTATWYSREIDAEDPSQIKKWYLCEATGNGSYTLKVEENGGMTLFDWFIAGTRAYSIMIKVSLPDGAYLNELTYVYRRMVGAR